MQHVARFIIKELSDSGFDSLSNPMGDISSYTVRRASRGLLILNDSIALLHVTAKNYHKLPGGGIELGETNEQAFRREIEEETGYSCNTPEESGITIEYRGEMKECQISYIFKASASEAKKQNFTEEEKKDGFHLKWVSFEEAKQLLMQDKPSDYESQFINQRDLAILEFYLRN